MRKVFLLLAIILMANVNSAMAQGSNPKVVAIADGDSNADGKLDEVVAVALALFFTDAISVKNEGGTVYYYNTATGKRLLWMEDQTFRLCEGVTPADKVSYTFTDEDKENIKGTEYEGYTGLTLTFCTETLPATVRHWQRFAISDPKALNAMFALEIFAEDGVINFDEDFTQCSDKETDQPLCYLLVDDPEDEDVRRVAISRQLTAPKTYNHDISLDTRLEIAEDEDVVKDMQALLGRDPREIRTVSLTFDPTDIPTNPSVDWAVHVADGTTWTEADIEEYFKFELIGINMYYMGLINVGGSEEEGMIVTTTEGKNLGTITLGKDAVTVHLAEGVSSDDDLVLELPDEGREGLVQMYADAEVPVTFDPYTVKTVSIRFPASSGIEGATLGKKERTATDRIFSIDGRRLQGKPTQKGLYIVGGRKVLVK